MSNEFDKLKHSRRLHQEESAIKKQLKIAKQNRMFDYASREEKQPHRLAKHHAMNCGNPKCMLCSNPRHTWNELTPQEKRLFQEMEILRGRHSNGLENKE